MGREPLLKDVQDFDDTRIAAVVYWQIKVMLPGCRAFGQKIGLERTKSVFLCARPSHNFLLVVADGRNHGIRIMENGSHQPILHACRVLKLVKEDVAVGRQ